MNYRNQRNHYDRSKPFSKNDGRDDHFEKVIKPLKDYFNDPADLYLPEGKAEQYAKKFERIQNHQIRKVLDWVKESKVYAERNQFEQAKKQMFVIVAMTAYNSGRNPDLKPLYDFIKNTISEKTIVSVEDIFSFDQFFTSIVAYHKLHSKK